MLTFILPFLPLHITFSYFVDLEPDISVLSKQALRINECMQVFMHSFDYSWVVSLCRHMPSHSAKYVVKKVEESRINNLQ